MAGGTWDLLEAVATEWDSAGLDSVFTAEWNDPGLAGNFPVLSDGEQAEGTPFPYCVFEQDSPVREATMSSDSTAVNVLWRCSFLFRVYARNKTTAVNMVKAIAAVFDNARLTAGESTVVRVTKTGDFSKREGDEEWSWTLEYDAQLSTCEPIN